MAGEIGARVARAGYTVVSGAAFGIDQAAHRGALAAGGRTVAVLACGVDRAYPAGPPSRCSTTWRRPRPSSPSSRPAVRRRRIRFLSRNRIIAALARGTVVVEAAVRSGALNTAGWAARLHRPLMGVPGPVNAAQSEGVHQLVRKGAATLVTRGEEVLELVGAERPAPRRATSWPRSRPRDPLPERPRQVLEAVPLRRPAHSDSIARTAGIGLLDTRSALRRLERGGFVEHGSGRLADPRRRCWLIRLRKPQKFLRWTHDLCALPPSTV